MNFQETLELIQELRRSGATHFKSPFFEITMKPSESAYAPIMQGGQVPEVKSVGLPMPKADPVEPQNVEATEKVKELIGTLKLNDEQLLDKLFPDGAGG